VRRSAFPVALVLVIAACGGTDVGVNTVVAAGTTIVDNGVVEYLVAASPFAESTDVLAATSAEALTLLEQGAADLAIVHAPDRLAAFLESNPQAQSAVLFESRFVLVGPPGRAGDFDGLTAPQAFAEIASRGEAFVTRADGSGTYESESKVWDASDVDPAGAEWLTTTGQGMGFTLQVAVDREAFVWVEEGTLAGSPLASRVQIVNIADADAYPNIYTGVWLESGTGGVGFVDWIRSSPGATAMVAMNGDLFGRDVVTQTGSQ
jgi:tungstate transport system substrate-binding protein